MSSELLPCLRKRSACSAAFLAGGSGLYPVAYFGLSCATTGVAKARSRSSENRFMTTLPPSQGLNFLVEFLQLLSLSPVNDMVVNRESKDRGHDHQEQGV